MTEFERKDVSEERIEIYTTKENWKTRFLVLLKNLKAKKFQKDFERKDLSQDKVIFKKIVYELNEVETLFVIKYIWN